MNHGCSCRRAVWKLVREVVGPPQSPRNPILLVSQTHRVHQASPSRASATPVSPSDHAAQDHSAPGSDLLGEHYVDHVGPPSLTVPISLQMLIPTDAYYPLLGVACKAALLDYEGFLWLHGSIIKTFTRNSSRIPIISPWFSVLLIFTQEPIPPAK